MSDPSNPVRRWGKRLGLLVVTLFVLLLLLEGGLRVYSHFFFPKLMTTDAVLGWKHNPNRQKSFKNEDKEENLVIQNEFGHRGKSYGTEKTPGKFRVLALGDSFTEAVQVSETQVFTSLLEQSDESLQVMNAGVGAWGTVQQLLYLREHGRKLNPDLVLIMVYQNDLTDNCTPYSPGIGARPWAKLAGSEVRVVEQYDDSEYLKFVAPVPFRSFLSRNSYLFYALNERVWQRMKKAELRRMQDQYRRALDPKVTEKVFYGLVDRLRDMTSEFGIKLAIALIPTREMVASGKADWHQRLVAHGEKKGFACLSLMDALVAAKKRGRRCYFESDIHWTKEGHAVAAVALLPFVQKVRGGK